MGFMQAYKRLDMLCRDMNGIGVTGYIVDMEQAVNGVFHVPSWRTDYRQLKHYRYIRNQIAHEPNATEGALCSAEDTAWLEAFYQRILQRTDPLAMYRRSMMIQQNAAQPRPPRPAPERPVYSYQRPVYQGKRGIAPGAVIIPLVAILAVLVFLLMR